MFLEISPCFLDIPVELQLHQPAVQGRQIAAVLESKIDQLGLAEQVGRDGLGAGLQAVEFQHSRARVVGRAAGGDSLVVQAAKRVLPGKSGESVDTLPGSEMG